MKRFLLHPLATLSLVAAGCAALAAQVGAVVAALQPLEHIPTLSPHIAKVISGLTESTVILGAFAALCLAFAGAGRSFMTSIDFPAGPPSPGTSTPVPLSPSPALFVAGANQQKAS